MRGCCLAWEVRGDACGDPVFRWLCRVVARIVVAMGVSCMARMGEMMIRCGMHEMGGEIRSPGR